MLRIILNGSSGRMGKEIIRAVEAAEDCVIVEGIDMTGADGEESFPVVPSIAESKAEADVLLDFSSPEGVPELMDGLAMRKIPAVIATTGISEDGEKSIRDVSKRVAVLRAANMSIGVNLVKSLIFKTAMVLGTDFDVEIIEKHHNQKRDAPSGTAKMLADAVNDARSGAMEYVYGRHGVVGKRRKNALALHAVRGGTIVGEHDVLFAGADEMVEVSHKAYSRRVFAEGALTAARYIVSKPAGYFTMDDLVAEQTLVTNVYVHTEESLIEITGIPVGMGNIADIFQKFASENINIDMISQVPGVAGTLNISFTVECDSGRRLEEVMEALLAGMEGVAVKVEDCIAKVTVEGLGMETQSGVAFRVFRCMAEAGILIKAVTTSETKIAFVVAESDRDGAVEAVKAEFMLGC